MKKYSATVTIDAPPSVVWEILTDAQGYPQWDHSMKHIEGTLALGEKVTFHTVLSEQAFPVKVTEFEPAKKMVLTGGLPLGLFKSQRTHLLTSAADGRTTFQTEEIFSGPLLPLFARNLPDLSENFANFAAALRQQAEAKAAPN